jgi:hypothetical protein
MSETGKPVKTTAMHAFTFSAPASKTFPVLECLRVNVGLNYDQAVAAINIVNTIGEFDVEGCTFKLENGRYTISREIEIGSEGIPVNVCRQTDACMCPDCTAR